MTPLELLAATLAITVGSMVQAASDARLPVAVLDIDREHLSPVFFGLVPGSALGAWIISSLPAEQLGLVFAVVILLAIAVVVSLSRKPFYQEMGEHALAAAPGEVHVLWTDQGEMFYATATTP